MRLLSRQELRRSLVVIIWYGDRALMLNRLGILPLDKTKIGEVP